MRFLKSPFVDTGRHSTMGEKVTIEWSFQPAFHLLELYVCPCSENHSDKDNYMQTYAFLRMPITYPLTTLVAQHTSGHTQK